MKQTINKRALGTLYEERIADHLKGSGYTILKKNFRCKIGEIDLIAKDGEYLVFVEVKYRSSSAYGGASRAVNLRKQRTISAVAMYYLVTENLSADTPCRFDVAAVSADSIEIIKNAFPYRR